MIFNYPHSQRHLDLSLDRGAVLDVLPSKTGVSIDVVEGALWITQTGDPKDHILSAGDSFRAMGGGMLVVQALEPSVMTAH